MISQSDSAIKQPRAWPLSSSHMTQDVVGTKNLTKKPTLATVLVVVSFAVSPSGGVAGVVKLAVVAGSGVAVRKSYCAAVATLHIALIMAESRHTVTVTKGHQQYTTGYLRLNSVSSMLSSTKYHIILRSSLQPVSSSSEPTQRLWGLSF